MTMQSIDQQLMSQLDSQKKYYTQSRYPSAALRKDRLQRLSRLLIEQEDAIVNAVSEDFNYRSADQTRFADVITTLREIRHNIKHLARWMKPQRRKVGLPFNLAGASAKVYYQPLGVVGIISPWNFPINLCFSPLAGVLAAGNLAMLKPSDLTPSVSAWMARTIPKYFSDHEIQVVTGDVQVAQAFSALPFDHLVYTGGENVAKQIMRAASTNLTPLTLELGGKSPVIVTDTANLKLCANRVLFGKIFNAGQVCLAPDTLHIPVQNLNKFISELQDAASKQLANIELDQASIINERHRQRLQFYIDEARAKGVQVITLNQNSEPTSAMPISIIVNPPNDMRVSSEEIFGPVLLIRTYTQFDELVIGLTKDERPLALYCFGANAKQRKLLLEESHSGGVTFDDVIMHYTIADLPFGGVGASGFGCYHGRDGFVQFSHSRSVFTQTRFDVAASLRTPYGKGFQMLLNQMRRWL